MYLAGLAKVRTDWANKLLEATRYRARLS